MKEEVLDDLGGLVGDPTRRRWHAGWVIQGDLDKVPFAKVREAAGKCQGQTTILGLTRVWSLLSRLRDRGQQWAWTPSLGSDLGSLEVGSPPVVTPSKGAGRTPYFSLFSSLAWAPPALPTRVQKPMAPTEVVHTVQPSGSRNGGEWIWGSRWG